MAQMNYDSETSKLNDYELDKVVPILARCLINKVGREKATTNSYMVKKLKECGYDVNDIRIRKCINYMRTRDVIERLIASHYGYYVTNDAEELAQYCGTLRQREEAIANVRMAMEAQLERLKADETMNDK